MLRPKRRQTHNPLLQVDGLMDCFITLPVEARDALQKACRVYADSARAKAQASWLGNKGPMALYWKWSGVNARHLSRLLQRLKNLESQPEPDRNAVRKAA